MAKNFMKQNKWFVIIAGIIILYLIMQNTDIGRGYDVGGYRCNKQPESPKYYTDKTYIECRNNNPFPITCELIADGPDIWGYKGRREVMPGKVGGFSGLDSSQKYRIDIYLCSEELGLTCNGAKDGQYRCIDEGEVYACDNGKWDYYKLCSELDANKEDNCLGSSTAYYNVANEACEDEPGPECNDGWYCSGSGDLKQCVNGKYMALASDKDQCSDYELVNDCVKAFDTTTTQNVCKKTVTKYACVDNQCVEQVGGQYTSLTCDGKCGTGIPNCGEGELTGDETCMCAGVAHTNGWCCNYEFTGLIPCTEPKESTEHHFGPLNVCALGGLLPARCTGEIDINKSCKDIATTNIDTLEECGKRTDCRVDFSEGKCVKGTIDEGPERKELEDISSKELLIYTAMYRNDCGEDTKYKSLSSLEKDKYIDEDMVDLIAEEALSWFTFAKEKKLGLCIIEEEELDICQYTEWAIPIAEAMGMRENYCVVGIITILLGFIIFFYVLSMTKR